MAALTLAGAGGAGAADVSSYGETARRIIEAARADSTAWDRLTELTDRFGSRLSGSPSLEAALHWSAERMREDGFDRVDLEPVSVRHWVRGEESLEVVEPFPDELVMLGLGNSIGTRPEGLTAGLLVVSSFDELDARASEVPGRIVLYDVPFTSYGETVAYRAKGPSRAAALGARAVLVRSVGTTGLRTPHTGALDYDEEQPLIPAAAVAAEDAARLHRLAERGRVTLRLRMDAHFLPDAQSANLLGELRGRERPDEIVLLGGHIDSWDVGTGAMDDGGGCMVTWAAVRLLKQLGLRPRRTLRVVLFTNEENGLAGGRDYAARHRDELERHVMALESDSGVFRPTGFGFTGSDAAREVVEEVAALLEPIGASGVGPRGGGADIGPAVEAAGIPSMALAVDGPYFTYHHTRADTIDRLDPDDVASCVAAVAVMAYTVADLPDPLPRD